MTTIKIALESIGSAGGLALPLFGIVTAALGLTIGGYWVWILASISGLIFVTVTPLIFFILYKTQYKKEKKMEFQLSQTIDNLSDEVSQYLLKIYQNYLLENRENFNQDDWLDFLSLQLHEELSMHSPSSSMTFFLQILLNEKELFEGYGLSVTPNYTDEPPKEKLFTAVKNKSAIHYPCTSHATAYFMGFVGMFGTIAGLSAGIVGFLTTLDFLSGFTFPIGSVVLITAVIVGLVLGQRNASNSREYFFKKNIHKSLVSLQKNLNKSATIRNLSNHSGLNQEPRDLSPGKEINNLKIRKENLTPLTFFTPPKDKEVVKNKNHFCTQVFLQ